MNVLAETLTRLRIGEPQTFAGLTVLPLFGAGGDEGAAHERGYLTLDEALAAGTVSVTEVGEAGRVPELRLENRGDLAVLLLDGEELVGAKQNRVLNLTVLAPAGKTIVIPVSCVEQGRWHSLSKEFDAMPHVMTRDARLAKARAVSNSMRASGAHLSDQGEVWAAIAGAAQRYRSPSATGAMGEIYRRHGKSLDEYVAAFPARDGQVGAVFAVAGKVRGAEAFDHAKTLAGLLPKVVRSWALEVIDRPSAAHAVPSGEDARGFLDQVAAAALREHPGVGLGNDYRFEDPTITGGALVHDGRLVHVCAFGPEPGEAAGTYRSGQVLSRRGRRTA